MESHADRKRRVYRGIDNSCVADARYTPLSILRLATTKTETDRDELSRLVMLAKLHHPLYDAQRRVWMGI